MSCRQNSNAAGKAAATGAGLPELSSKMGYVYGVAAETATRGLDAAGKNVALPVSTLLLKLTEPKGAVGAVQKSALKQLAAGAGRVTGKVVVRSALVITGTNTTVKTANKMMSRAEKVTGLGGTMIGALSKTENAGSTEIEKRRLFGPSTQSVQLWKSRLTPLFNGYDVIGARDVTAGTGVMFKTGGRTWHKGTTQFNDGQRKRTVTHLRSLSLPGDNYYFNRPVSNKSAVGIAAGQIKAERVPGYVGKITKSEAMCGAWLYAKKTAILSQIHWG